MLTPTNGGKQALYIKFIKEEIFYMVNTELLNCPFCNGTAELKHSTEVNAYCIICATCRAQSSIEQTGRPVDFFNPESETITDDEARQTVIDRWNKRSSLMSVGDEILDGVSDIEKVRMLLCGLIDDDLARVDYDLKSKDPLEQMRLVLLIANLPGINLTLQIILDYLLKSENHFRGLARAV